MSKTFQDLILALHQFWSARGCLIWQPYNQQVGAGTMNPATYLRVLGPEPWNVAYVEPSVRPDDGRYGENPNRLYTHTQYQVILKPTPENSQELYLESLAAIGVDLGRHDIRFVEDNWAQPAIGAWGLGWEVWLDGLEITQYTYFQQVGGVALDPVPLEITYGLERIAMALQGVRSVFDLKWDAVRSFGDVRLQDEIERSKYAFDQCDVEMLMEQFDAVEREGRRTITAGLVLPAHDSVLNLSNIFNLLDTRGAIGVTERQRFLGRVRDLAREVAASYVLQREALGYPWLKQPQPALRAPEPAPAVPAPSFTAAPPAAGTLLFEIGVEELPAGDVEAARTQLARLAPEALAAARLTHGALSVLATPRRLAVIVRDVAARQTSIDEHVKGPGAKVAFDKDGMPTQAALAFAKRMNVDPAELVVVEDGKTAYVYARRREPGLPATDVLPAALGHMLSKLAFEKTMRWNASNVAFARPLQWYVALLDDQPIPFEYAGIRAGVLSTGSRGRGSPRFVVDHAARYETLLAGQGILADVGVRKAEIQRQVDAVAARVGGRVEADDNLLDEVTQLVEQPAALLADFDPDFLKIPAPVLTKVMRSKQRYFTVVDAASGALLPHFITVRNGPDADSQAVIAGNEDVVHARFADANYFFKRDIERPLESLLPRLDTLTFQTRLGSMLDKARRIESLVDPLTTLLDGGRHLTNDAVRRASRDAARLCKADLVSLMVVEITSLQGVMGREYLLRQGGDPATAEAVFEHYLPRFAGDRTPATPAGLIVALADKLDSIAGLFGVGLAPKGSADPFALRRSAIGIVQCLVDNKADFSLHAGLTAAAARLPERMSTEAVQAALRFIAERARAALIESGLRHDVVDAALSTHADNPWRAWQVAGQLAAAVERADWPALLAAYSRCARITKGFTDDGRAAPADPEPASVALAAALDVHTHPDDVAGLMDSLARLEPSIRHFFDIVLVNAEDAGLRLARQRLVMRVVDLAAGVADLTKLEGF